MGTKVKSAKLVILIYLGVENNQYFSTCVEGCLRIHDICYLSWDDLGKPRQNTV